MQRHVSVRNIERRVPFPLVLRTQPRHTHQPVSAWRNSRNQVTAVWLSSRSVAPTFDTHRVTVRIRPIFWTRWPDDHTVTLLPFNLNANVVLLFTFLEHQRLRVFC